MGAIAFAQIPIDWRDPGVYMENDPRFADAGAGVFPLVALLFAQKLAAGTGATLTPYLLTDEALAEELGGAGSMAARDSAEWLAHNRVTETYLVLLEDGVGQQAAGTMTFSGTVAAGVLNVYVGGDRVPVVIADGDTLVDVAAAVVAAVTLTHGVSMIATVNGGQTEQVIFTYRHAGEVGNHVDIRTSHLDGEVDPPGLVVTLVQPNGGTVNPTAGVTAAFAALTGVQYDIIAHPYTDNATLDVIEDEMADRADALNAIPGVAITGAVDTQGLLAALGSGRNSEFSSIIGFETFPGSPAERSAAIAGLVARFGAADPARPFQTLDVQGFAPNQNEQFSSTSRDALLHDGISTVKVGAGSQVKINRMISTYQETPGGAPSDAYLDINTLLTLSYVRKSFVARFSRVFPRSKLGADGGAAPGAGSVLVSPSVAKAEAMAWYAQLVELEIVQNIEGFQENTIFQISPSDPTRLETVLAIYLVSPLRVVAALNQFRRSV